MGKTIKLMSLVTVLLLSISSFLSAEQETGIPKVWMNQEGVYLFGNNTYVKLANPVSSGTGRCWQGTLAGTMYLNTHTEIGKQMLSLVLSASMANKPILVDYTYTTTNNDCVVNSVSVP